MWLLKNVRNKEKPAEYHPQFSLNKRREGHKQARAPQAQACAQALRKEDPGGKENWVNYRQELCVSYPVAPIFLLSSDSHERVSLVAHSNWSPTGKGTWESVDQPSQLVTSRIHCTSVRAGLGG